jgi:hypothetical protein
MTRQKLTVGAIAAAFTISLAPAWAGPARDAQSGSRSSNGETTGTAVPRDSGGGSAQSAAPRDSGGGTATSSPSASAPAGDSGSSGAGWMGGNNAASAAPTRAPRSERAEDQRRGGGSSSGQAVPRGSSSSGGNTESAAGSSGGNDRDEGRRGRTPGYSRPRDGREPVGTAVDRRGAPPRGGGGAYYPGVIYDPYYASYYDPYFYGGRYSSYWSPYGYGFGLGYFAYDPFLFGGYGGYGYGPYQGGYGPGYDPYQGGYGSESGYRGVGSIRLKVKPADAQVYVDGYYVGTVDSFDGAFQRLSIEAGAHKVEVRAEGYETVQFDVMVTPGETVTYKGELKRR